MSITILPAKFEDAYDLAACNVDTFQSDPLYQDMFGLSDTATPEEQEGNIEFRKGLFEASLRKPHAHIFKAADDSTNLLVGYAGFVEPENRHEAEETELELGNVPQNLNRQRLKEIGARIKDAQKKGLGDRKDYWCLSGMGVRPSYQRRGVAQRLMSHGLALVDAKGEDIYLGASPAGRKLYERNGFEALAEVELAEGILMAAMFRKSPR
ncbi:hypothetical protein LTR37_014611 [Vermiconidia calcicola]|uniref:Uncharacterized protein n=1 Tax=Vermiconidia calcicola TaxID=1690605 RepID=A0ACC3MU72_9PEZI|nr:hypothetical protein LTR37_014611 [Vermiconidia calcicola]